MSYCKIIMFVTLNCLLVADAQILMGDDRDKAISIIENCIASRNAIKSMDCTLKIHRKLRNGGETDSYLEIMMEGDKIRAKKLEDNRPIYLFVNCYQPNSFGFLNLKPNVLSKIKPVPESQSMETEELNLSYLTLMNNDALKDDTPEERSRFMFVDRRDNALPNPRFMGQTPSEYADLFVHNSDLDADYHTLKNQASDIQVSEEIVDHKNLTKVSWTHPVKVLMSKTNSDKPPIELKCHVKFWFDIECGSTIRKASVELGRSTISVVLTNEIVQDKQSGIWFPYKWKFVEKSGGYELIEDYELEMISINKSISPKNFDLSSVKELIPGTTVRWEMDSPPPAEGKLVWDGRKVVGLSEFKFGVATAERSTSRRWFVILVNTAGISAIIAILCFRSWRRQQRI